MFKIPKYQQIMKITKLLFALAFMASVVIGCKKGPDAKEESKANIEALHKNSEQLALNISGMTCEIGCAKMIESKLAKQDGVVDAKVIFNDSLAKISYDPAKTNKASLISLVEGMAGNMYKAAEVEYKSSCDRKEKACSGDCKEKCCSEKKAKACASDCEKECCKVAKACSTDCNKDCCVAEAAEKACALDCKKKCCA